MGALARVPIVKEGWVVKRNKQGASLNSSKKKYLTLTEDGNLAYYASKSDFSEDKDRKVVDVIRTTGPSKLFSNVYLFIIPVKVPGRSGQPNSKGENSFDFTVVSSTGDQWNFSSDSIEDRDSWVDAIEQMFRQR